MIEPSIEGWKLRAAKGALLAALVLWPAVAAAPAGAAPPRITAAPVITGTAQVGQILQAGGADWRPRGGTTATWSWWRCTGPQLTASDCAAIPGATGTAYSAVAGDEGFRLRVLLAVRGSVGGSDDDEEDDDDASPSEDELAYAMSAATPPVTSVLASPTAAVPGLPTESVSGDLATDLPAFGLQGIEPPASGGQVPELLGGQAPTMMRPAPVVRIRGRLSRRGARITLLTVRAPRGARISVTCRGRSCPARRWAQVTAVTRLVRFQRDLQAGTRLVIEVTKPAHIGKRTAILIRRDEVPQRTDRCLYPGSSRPVRCPAT